MSQRSASRGFRELASGRFVTINMKRRCTPSLAARGDGGDGEWAPEDDGTHLISAPSPESEPVLIERGRREAHRCDQRTTVVLALQSCGWQARGAGAGLRRAREASGAVERWLEHRCPRNNTWHRPKLSTGVRDRSMRTQCTSLSHGGARAPEEMYRPLSEDKTASTIHLP